MSELGIHPEIIDHWLRHYICCKQKNEPVVFDSVYSIGEDPSSIIHIRCCVIHRGGNEFSFLAQDITSLKQVEEELRKAKVQLEEQVIKRTNELASALQVKSRFLAVMSHGIIAFIGSLLSTLLNSTVISFFCYDCILENLLFLKKSEHPWLELWEFCHFSAIVP